MRRATAPLSDLQIRTVSKGTRFELADGEVPGLGLRVLPSGRKFWFLRYGPSNGRRRITFGEYPALSLKKARDKARELLGGVKVHDRDPMAERKAERAARKKAGSETFEALSAFYLEEHAKRHKRLRPWKEDERKLRVEVLPVWGSRPAAQIRRTDVRELLETIAAERGGVCANRTRTLISRVFSFGMEKERVESNPVHGLKRLYAEKPRERVLSEDEIRTLWPLFDRLQPAVSAAWRLVLLTAQRPGEVLAMRDLHLDRYGVNASRSGLHRFASCLFIPLAPPRVSRPTPVFGNRPPLCSPLCLALRPFPYIFRSMVKIVMDAVAVPVWVELDETRTVFSPAVEKSVEENATLSGPLGRALYNPLIPEIRVSRGVAVLPERLQ